jgi:phenylalanyl-tRNA synthetase beta subunit
MFDAKFDFTPVSQNEIFYDSECVSIDYMGIVIGYIGCIKKSKIPSKISDKKLYCATINLQKLIHSFKLKDVKYNNYSPLAFIIKDVTLKATNKTKLQPVIEEIMKNDFIEKYEFVGKFSKEENINYTLRFYIKNRDKIQSNEIDEYFTIILDILKKHNLF